jgi:8-oxo-dGTP pyrophosphatase MutT (NUDIX family)
MMIKMGRYALFSQEYQMAMLKEKSCGALVYRVKDSLGGHWSFPKGHVEDGETEQQTALREVLEETGLRVSLLENFRHQVSYSPRAGVDKDVVYFLGYAEDSRTTRQEEEISEIRWVNSDKCHEYLTYQNDRQLLDSAKEFLKPC